MGILTLRSYGSMFSFSITFNRDTDVNTLSKHLELAPHPEQLVPVQRSKISPGLWNLHSPLLSHGLNDASRAAEACLSSSTGVEGAPSRAQAVPGACEECPPLNWSMEESH